MQKATAKTTEPNYAAACNWWSDLPNIWTQRFRNGKFFGWRTLWQGCFSALVVCRVEFSVKNILPTMFFVAQNH